MSETGNVVVVGGSAGIGKEVARHYVGLGRDVVIVGRDVPRASAVARELGDGCTQACFDLAQPEKIASALAGLGPVGYLVLAAIDRDQNTTKGFSVERAITLVTLKLVGYLEVIHTLSPRMGPDSAIVLFGGVAKDRPYPGSTTVSTVNGGVSGMARSLIHELAPIRVNVIHPGIVGDSPYWSGKADALERTRARTLTGRLATMEDIVGAVAFLLENPAVNGVELYVDGGWNPL